ncbi:MAG: trans-2-enoyl-CoA reductase family protein [bacterium]|jgi:enoyl-[acyl-carrier protein] reductase/trans-2-enoyl-CoA reductase (NAD+)|nr:trans-2-enoyl-CoA reductase family protein [bacterium]
MNPHHHHHKVQLTPRTFGFISTVAHPVGLEREVARQIRVACTIRRREAGGTMLVLGSSMGYGLAARITAAFGYGMKTLGVSFDRPHRGARTATAGWYNNVHFQRAARLEGLWAESLTGDAFSRECLEETLERVTRDLGPLDYLVYSLAAPRRADPVTGEVYQSVLKAVGRPHPVKMIDTSTFEITEGVFEAATEDEVRQTVGVMGGADLRRWSAALIERGLLKPGARILAFSYIGPEVTHPIYRDGSIGLAKLDLEAACRDINGELQARLGGLCHTVVAKSIVTQSSAAIPAIALYISLVYRVMKEKGLHETAIEQMRRLFREHIAPGKTPRLDEAGRIRLDEFELRDDVQQEVKARWDAITTETVPQLCDVAGYKEDFLRLFGFEVKGVDYSLPVRIDLDL